MIFLKNLNTQLNDLRLNFEQAIINGNVFSDVKNIYLQMKEVKMKISGEHPVKEDDSLEQMTSDCETGSSGDDSSNEIA